MLIDREVGRSHALVVDANAATRGVIVQMLRSLGFRHIRQAQRLRDARDLLEVRRFDLVVCDHDLHTGGDGSSQALLDELQRSKPLPLSTVFVMVTGEATYAKVAEAAEAALDSYLVKPFTAQTLADRIRDARARKRALKPVFDALQAHDDARAAALCVERFMQRQPYGLYSARVGAELLLRLKRPAEARRLYEAVQALRPQPWAALGVARAQLAQGENEPARRGLLALLQAEPTHADAMDVLGQLQLEQGQFDEALHTFTRAARLTPDCVLRQQQCGAMAFYAGNLDQASQALQQAAKVGRHSRLFDAQSLLLLALLQHDDGDGRALLGSAQALQACAAAHPDSDRLRRMLAVAQALVCASTGEAAQAQALAAAMLAEAERPDFDIEAALHALALWSRLSAAGVPPAFGGDAVRVLARRFCASKAAAELLQRALQRQPEGAGWVREIQTEIQHTAEEAMNRVLQGDPGAAALDLLAQGERTRNAKLIDMAVSVVNRHRDRIGDAPRLLGEAGALAHRYAHGQALPRVRRQGRLPGGVALRV
jgi:DNA-binding NarL/FixJ family response regulator/Flp pilus assembly protein TadD